MMQASWSMKEASVLWKFGSTLEKQLIYKVAPSKFKVVEAISILLLALQWAVIKIAQKQSVDLIIIQSRA